jgi:hypothetical protein
LVADGCIVDRRLDDPSPAKLRIEHDLTVKGENGFTLELWLTVDRFTPDQVLLDTRSEGGDGWAISVGQNNTLKLTISDGRHASQWECDPGSLTKGKTHHIAFVVDGGPGIISVIVDGVLCDGGGSRQFGWGRFDPDIDNVSGTRVVSTDLGGARVHRLRVYERHLRTAEIVQNYRVGVR